MNRLTSLGCFGLFLAACASTASVGDSRAISVSLIEFVRTQRVVDHGALQRLRAAIKIENKSAESHCFVGYREDNKINLLVGAEGQVEFLRPGGKVWLPFVGSVDSGPDSRQSLCIRPGEPGTVFIEWPIDFLVNYHADTLFRITVVDQDKQKFTSAPFKLHDGVIKLRDEVIH